MALAYTRLLQPLLLSAALATGVDASPAGSPSVPGMTLQQALSYARVHNPSLQTAKSRLAEQEALSRVPGQGWLPKIGAGAQVFVSSLNNTTAMVAPSSAVLIPRIGGRTADPTASWGDGDSWHAYPSTFVGIGISQQVYDFGLLAARTAAADAELAAERFRLTGSTLDVVLSVNVSYYSARAAQAVLGAAVAAVSRAQAERDQAEASVKAGLLPPIYLDRAEAELARFEVGVVRARGGLQVARMLFANTVGYEGPLLDAIGVGTATAVLPDLTRSLELAFAQDPRLAALGQELRARQQETQSIWAELRPNLLATATLSSRAGGAPATANGASPSGGGWVPETPNWDVGLLLNFPLFDPVVSARARAATEREQVIQSEILEARSAVAVAVSQAYELADEARRTIPALRRALEAARRNEAQAAARFASGLGTSVELADAEGLLADAEVQSAVGDFEVGRTQAFLDRAVGGLP